MDREPLRRLLRSLRQVTEPADAAAVSDARLLERFVASRDQAAFELLLRRHGPMVLGVCRRLLAQPHDAEDAFQATFLTLVRKADSIAHGAAVGSWLYQVAYRVSLRARAARAARARREQRDVDRLPAPAAEPAWPDLRDVLDEEVNRLPARQRAAFVLCCLEGKTGEEAARELGCRPGTVSSRLTRARERLRSRLLRRGLAPAALGVLAAGEALAVPLPGALVDSTLKAALLFATGQAAGGALSAQAVTLAEGVLRAMFLTKLKIAAFLLLMAGLLAVGGALTRHALEAAPPAKAPKAASPAPAQRTPPAAKTREGPVVVRVVKPQAGGVDRTTQVIGNVQAFDEEEIVPAVAGVLKELAVDLGDQVKKGQVLAEIDAPLLVLEQKHAVVGVQQARGQVQEAEAHIAAAQAEVNAAHSVVLQRQVEVDSAQSTLALRQRQLDRMKRLHEQGSVDERIVGEREGEVEAARSQAAAARAALANARADLKVKQSKVAQAEAVLATTRANLELAQVALEKAHYMLGLTRITSPVDGVVTRRNYQNGHYFRLGERSEPLPLLTIQRTDRVRVVVQVVEEDVPLTRVGAPVDLAIIALPNSRFAGYKVSRIGFAEDPRWHTMRVEIDVPNPTQQLRPGMNVTATILLHKGSAQELRIPARSLIPPQALSRVVSGLKPGDLGYAVYVVRDGKAHRTPVEVGGLRPDANAREVGIVSGLKPTDLLVTDHSGLKGDVVPVQVKEGPR